MFRLIVNKYELRYSLLEQMADYLMEWYTPRNVFFCESILLIIFIDMLLLVLFVILVFFGLYKKYN